MDEWLHIVIRQITLYLLPVIISLTLVCLIEKRYARTAIAHPFFAMAWSGAWWPFLASIFFTRGVIFALPQPLKSGLKPAFIRFSAHFILTLLGLMLYTWSLSHQAPAGLPPLHHWWAKVFMFFNLCMLGIHLLPLPNLLFGEWLITQSHKHHVLQIYAQLLTNQRSLWLITLLAASPIIDIGIGANIIFPIYGYATSIASHVQ